MTRKPLTLLFIIVLLTHTISHAQTPLDLGSRREIFVDHYLIDRMQNARLQLHHPRNEGVVLQFDKPWEGNFSGYCTIIRDGDLLRAYYRGVRNAVADGDHAEVTCYAESKDGKHWTKPDLGINTVDGSKNNNTILANSPPVTHNFSPFLDRNPKVTLAERFKALGGTKKSGLMAYASADGVHWNKMATESVFTKGLFDSQNVAFWSESEGKYVCYFRTWTGDGFNGFRTVSRATSDDFLHWSEPEPMTFGNTPMEHLYTQQTSPYYRAPHIYLAIGARFMPNRQVVSDEDAKRLNVNPKYYNDCSDAILMSSRGGSVYDRTFMDSFIRPGIGLSNWVSRSNYPALNVVQTSDTEMSVFVNEEYAQPTAHLKRYSMRIDGFASLTAPYQGGEVVTKPFVFSGKELEINYATSAAGELKIELQDASGKAIPGFTIDDCPAIIGNEIRRVVRWKGGGDVSQWASRPVRLRIAIKDGDLYSLKFN
ncbi:hypothetical protein SAMN05216327_11379 [Dyadobacter sp. SG02]|uniref:hypothetical protein n=1 Tax=Dyadobacter sp. SG02 TaxID=1855291 RepID=UPI0008B827F2|nr:hypothetical protein [Dyadobacter sp. SG02]SEJ58506.1 hypothetical protein SAMN05216327_11379 [Dyadobacter sp. SG02]